MRDQYSRYYGTNQAHFDRLCSESEHRCNICGKEEIKVTKNGARHKLSLDHNHKTGQIRGVLCDRHNKALGLFNDDPELLLKAYNYLMKYQ